VARLTQTSETSEPLDSSEEHQKSKKARRLKGRQRKARVYGMHVEVAVERGGGGFPCEGLGPQPEVPLHTESERDSLRKNVRDSTGRHVSESEGRSEGEKEAATQSSERSGEAEKVDSNERTMRTISVPPFENGCERLILLWDCVLVPQPDLERCAMDLRHSWGLEASGEGSKGLRGLGAPILAGWPSAESAKSSGSESGGSVDSEAADQSAEVQSQKSGVSSEEQAGHKRSRSEVWGADDAPVQKVQKVGEGGQGLGVLGSGKGGVKGDGWWPDDELEVGFLADFADFGDAFGDLESFGEVRFNNKAISSCLDVPVSFGPSLVVSCAVFPGLCKLEGGFPWRTFGDFGDVFIIGRRGV
jgi:hypothetical protein